MDVRKRTDFADQYARARETMLGAALVLPYFRVETSCTISLEGRPMSGGDSATRTTAGIDVFWFYALLGSVFAAIALASFGQKVLGVGFAPPVQEVIDKYRELVHPVMERLLSVAHVVFPAWQIPDWVKDLYALSFVGGFSASRGAASVSRFRGLALTIPMLVLGILLSLSWAGFVYLLVAPFASLSAHASQFRTVMRRTTFFILLALFGAALFFIVSAQGV